MRKKIVAGNWKMNLLSNDVDNLLSRLNERSEEVDCDLIVFPSSVYLERSIGMLNKISVGAQNVSEKESGAFTGEISMEMIKSLGCEYSLVGHSERRSYYGETDQMVNIKTKVLLENNLKPIVCCGETLEEREAGKVEEVVLGQIKKALEGVAIDMMKNVVLAYEPVWAIGTGVTASADQAQEVHAMIRVCLTELFGEEISNSISILYGGSCKPTNAAELFSCPDIDGGLIGGASLKADSFIAIAESF